MSTLKVNTLQDADGSEFTGFNVVKLQSVESGTTVSDITFDSLDTTSYKFFKLVMNTLPEVDNAYVNFRFRVGGSDQSSSSGS